MFKGIFNEKIVAVKKFTSKEKEIFVREIWVLKFLKDKRLSKKFINIFGAVEVEMWIVMEFIEGISEIDEISEEEMWNFSY